MLASALATGLSREPSEGNGWPFARPEAFSASYSVTDQKLAAGIFGGRLILYVLPPESAVPSPCTPEEFAAFIRAEQAKWGPVVAATGVKLE